MTNKAPDAVLPELPDDRFKAFDAALIAYDYELKLRTPAGTHKSALLAACRAYMGVPAFDCCEVAAAVELVHAENVLAEVELITAGREDAYWSGFSQAVEEIANRLGVKYFPCVSPARHDSSLAKPLARPSIAVTPEILPSVLRSLAADCALEWTTKADIANALNNIADNFDPTPLKGTAVGEMQPARFKRKPR